MNNAAISLLHEEAERIFYRRSFRKITGSVAADILLQRMVSHFSNHNCTPFYKFQAPCAHPLYEQGASWDEELGFSASEFDTALNQIGFRIAKPSNKPSSTPITNGHLVTYWTDASLLTWYSVDMGLLVDRLEQHYAIANPA